MWLLSLHTHIRAYLCVSYMYPMLVEAGRECSTGATNDYELPYGCWKWKLCPLEEQLVFLTAEPHLQPWRCFLILNCIAHSICLLFTALFSVIIYSCNAEDQSQGSEDSVQLLYLWAVSQAQLWPFLYLRYSYTASENHYMGAKIYDKYFKKFKGKWHTRENDR